MAMSKKFDEVQQAAGSVSVTMETPANADKTSNPVNNDAKPNQPPVRTYRPDVPIAQVLGAGAGAPEYVDDPNLGSDGRFYADADEAKATWEAGRLDESGVREARQAAGSSSSGSKPSGDNK